MEKWFVDRTLRHINLVAKYLNRIVVRKPFTPGEIQDLDSRALHHDASKYQDPEYEPYVWISWMYKKKDEGIDFKIPDEIDADEATMHHITTNRHHPEYWQEGQVDLLNSEDRDGIPEKMVDATKMPYMDIIELCADWAAMSEEKGTNTPMEWAKKNIGERWKFTQRQEYQIYEILEIMWEE